MKRILSLIALSLISFVGFSQTKGISYQAVIIDPNPIEIPGKDVTAQPYVSKDVWIRFGIYAGTTLQYEELHKTKTDEYGLVNLIIGGGVNTGKAGTFTSLSWDGITKNIITNVSFDQGGRYTEVSNQKLTYTPYTLLAETAVKLAGVLPIASGGTGATNAIAARTNLGLGNVDNTSDVDKPVSTATLAILDVKESLANKSTNIIADSASSVKYPSVKAIKEYIDNRNSVLAQQANKANLALKATALETPRTINGIPFDGTANITIPVGVTPPDADATTKGLLQLAGDLSGTAALPVIAANSITTAKIIDGAVTMSKLAAGAVTATKIVDGAVTDSKISSIAGSKVTGNIAGNAVSVSGMVAMANGGTGATTAAGALTNLGAEAIENKSADLTADANSTQKYPSVKLIKDYVDTRVAAAGVSDGSITSAKIADATIVSADIAANAGITNAQLANSSTILGSTTLTLGGTVTSVTGLSSITSTGFTGDLTGNAATATLADAATKLAATKNINGVAFDGSSDITVTADATTLTGASLASNVLNSSLTSVGTITTGIWSATTIDVTKGGTGLTSVGDGQIPFGNGTAALGTSDKFKWNNTNGALTIGVNGADKFLQLDGYSPFGSLTVARIYTDASSGTPSDFVLGTYPNGHVDQLYLKQSNGFVGIRKSAPTTALDVNGTVTASAFSGPLTGNVTGSLTGNASTSTLADNISATVNTSLTSLANLSTVGTITSGIWSATTIDLSKGGTGATTATGALTNLGAEAIANKSTDLSIDANSTDKYPSVKLIKDYVDTRVASAGVSDGTITSAKITDATIVSADIAANAGITNGQLANSTTILGATTMTLGGTVTSVTGLESLSSTSFIGALTGNASTATKLATSRAINGVSFDGSADITIAADANTLTGTTLASNVVTSSLTSVGTITSGIWSGTAIAIANGGTGSTTKNFVDLTTAQTIAGAKTFSNQLTVPSIVLNNGTAIWEFGAGVGSTGISLLQGGCCGRLMMDDNGRLALGANYAPTTFQFDVQGNARFTQDVTAPNFLGNATTATTAGNITATSNTTLTSLTNLATVGTITSGTWSASTIDIAKGGTGATSAADARANLGLVIGTNVQAPLTAGSGISIASGTISATGLTTANLSSTAGITVGQLATSTTTLGSTTMSLGGTVTSVTGLTSLAATNLTGTLSGTATSLATGRTISTTGDVTYTSGIFDGTTNVTGSATLTNTTVTAGDYGSTTAIPTFTVDSKGRLTAAGTASIIAEAGTLSGTTLASNVVTSSLTGVATITSGTWNGSTIGVAYGGTGVTSSTGTGSVVLSNSPTLLTPVLGTASGTSLALSAGLTASNATVSGTITANAFVGNGSGITNLSNSATTATDANTASAIVVRDANGNFSANVITGTLSGTATALTTGRTISTTGDVAFTTGAFNGTSNVTGSATLTNTAVTAGSYGSTTAIPTFTVDSKGRLTAAGTASIIAEAGTLSGTTLASNVVTSSLTGVGTITSGVWSGTEVAIAKGGTGATTAAGARSNLGLVIGTDVQAPLTAGSGISIASGTISATGLTSSNLSTSAGITNGQLANSIIQLGSTTMTLGGTVTSVTGLVSVSSTDFTGALTGNASTATKLATSRAINGVNFDGSANITIAADANTLTGTTLASNVVTSSLTSVGTITSGVWSGTVISSNKGGAGSVSGLLKANGSGVVSAAVAGTDYQAPLTAGTSFIAPNAAITAATKTKITYDAFGLITAGADATTADIASSSDKRYVTDIQSGVLSNTSGTNTGDETASTIKTKLGIATLSGSNTGDQTITLTGDVTGTGTGSFAATLTNTAVTVGSYGSNTTIPTFTVDAKGRLTAAGSAAIIADAGTLSGTSLKSTVTGSSLTGVATITSGTWNGSIIGVAYGGTGVTASTGSGNLVLNTSPTLVTPDLGTPTSVTLTNGTGLPISTGVSGLGTGVATFLATPTSANLAGAVTGETGTGSLVFANTPTLVTPVIGAATGTSLSLTSNLSAAAGTFSSTLTAGASTLASAAITGDLAVNTNKFTVAGASGNTAIAGTLGVTGATTLSSTLGVTGATTLGSTLAVTGAGTFSSTLTAGASTLASAAITGAATVGGTLGVTGDVAVNTNKFTVAAASGNTVIAGTLGVTGATNLSSTLGVAGATTLGSTLAVTGAGTFSSTLSAGASTLSSASITGAATVGGTLGVTGATTLSSTLTAGTSTLTSLSVTNNGTVGGTLGVTGATTLGNTLGVSGATTLTSVTATGAATFSNTVKITTGAAAGKVLTSDATGNATWSNAGGTVTSTSSNTTYTTSNVTYIIFTGSTASQTIALPTASAAGNGREYTIKNVASVSVTISAGGSNIISDSTTTAATSALLGIEPSNNWMKLISDGTSWYVMRALF